MFSVEKQNIDFMETAPIRFTKSFELAWSVADFWNFLITYESWQSWFPNVTRVSHLSELKEGIGSIRKVYMGNFIAEEEFIEWQEQKVWAFSVTQLNLPILKGMIEKVSITQKEEQRVLIDWTVAAQLKWWVSPFQSLLMKDMNRNFDKMINNLYGIKQKL